MERRGGRSAAVRVWGLVFLVLLGGRGGVGGVGLSTLTAGMTDIGVFTSFSSSSCCHPLPDRRVCMMSR